MKTTLGIILILCALAVPATAQTTDRTLPVGKDVRLEISNYAGEVVIRAWDKDEVRIVADHGSRDEVEIESGERVLRVEARSSHGRPAIVDYQVQAPRWMDVEVQGPYCDMVVEGMEGQIYLETVEGEIRAVGGRGHVNLRSVEGDVSVRDAEGSIEIASVDGEITVSRVKGSVLCETVDGDVILEEIDSSEVEATSVDGEIRFDGAIHPEGQYRLLTHDGDIRVGIPEGAGLTLTVALVDGDFETCFPIDETKRDRGRRFELILGDGRARMELEAFDGDVFLCRPGGA
jgi:DUF4097 and DUF4098 domain-containing protein YvlB